MRQQACQTSVIPGTAEIDVFTVEGTGVGTQLLYCRLEAQLTATDFYTLLSISDSELRTYCGLPLAEGLNKSTSRSQSKALRDDLAFNTLYFRRIIVGFGSTQVARMFIWKIPAESTLRSDSKDTQMILSVHSLVPLFHSRAVSQEFVDKYKNICRVSPHMLRSMFSLLSGDASAARTGAESDVQDRLVDFIACGDDPELYPDLRALNGNTGHTYDHFWDAALHATRRASGRAPRPTVMVLEYIWPSRFMCLILSGRPPSC